MKHNENAEGLMKVAVLLMFNSPEAPLRQKQGFVVARLYFRGKKKSKHESRIVFLILSTIHLFCDWCVLRDPRSQFRRQLVN